MAKTSFDLVSPEKLVFSDDAGMIIVPGKDGDIGILPGHSKVISSLRSGRVMIYDEDKNLLKSFFVSGGFVEINPEKCIVLAESVNDMSELDKSAIEKEIQDILKSNTDNANDKINIAKDKLEALNNSFYLK
mgnify:FL=1